jgi:hypothetical protein
MEHLKIITAQVAQTKLISGTSILFTTDQVVAIDDLFKTTYEDKTLYFKVTVVAATDSEYLSISATQTGYYSQVRKMKGFDVRNLLDLPLELVEDAETIEKLRKESTFC